MSYSRVFQPGDFVKLNSDPRAGHEQAGWRPALVISEAAYNSRSGLALVCPITSQVKGYPFEVSIPQGAQIQGVVLSDRVKSVDLKARSARFIESAPKRVLDEALECVALLIGFK